MVSGALPEAGLGTLDVATVSTPGARGVNVPAAGDELCVPQAAAASASRKQIAPETAFGE